MRRLLIVFLTISYSAIHAEAPIFVSASTVAFISNAPLETIRANSTGLKGAIDTSNNTFYFRIQLNTFEGFNSGLQKEHFNENYLEVEEFPYATFKGKIIEYIDFNTNCKYEVRAKGDLNIHGKSQERIIKGIMDIFDESIKINSAFDISLADHDIRIPRVVNQKLAEKVTVNVDILMDK